MLFRVWYHACQLFLLGFALVFVGLAFGRARILLPIGLAICVPLGVCGGILGAIVALVGLRSACPRCAAPAAWVGGLPKSIIAVDCPQCGLVGGNPAWDLQPRTLHESYETEDDNQGKGNEKEE